METRSVVCSNKNGHTEIHGLARSAKLMLICLSFVRSAVDAIHLIKHFQLIY